MTVNNNTNRFVQTLNTVLENGRAEREKFLSYLSAAVTEITKTREDRDAAIAQVRDLNTKYKGAVDNIRQLQQVNKRLEHDVQTMMSALEAATREFAHSDAQMVDRVVALGNEFNLPGLVEHGRTPAAPRPRTVSSAPLQTPAPQRRAVARVAPMADNNVMDDDYTKTMHELGRLLNSSSSSTKPTIPLI
jgi:cell division protein FtsB